MTPTYFGHILWIYYKQVIREDNEPLFQVVT